MYTGRRILVVEDEPLIALLIADWLTELQCEVAGTVNSVPEALQVAGRMTLDAALLDVTLGGDTSFTLADSLLAREVPVAFITGRDTQSLPVRFNRAPVLQKPFDFDAMQRLLGSLLVAAGEKSP